MASIGDVTASVRANIAGYVTAMQQGAQATQQLGASQQAVSSATAPLNQSLTQAEQATARLHDDTAELAAMERAYAHAVMEAVAAQEQQSTAAVQAGTSFAALDQDIRLATADFKAGRISAQDYATALEVARAEAVQLRGTMANLSTQELGQFNRVLAATAAQTTRTAVPFGTMRRSLGSLAAQAIGVSGVFGTLGSSLLLFAAGSAVVSGIVAGLALVAYGVKKITQNAREAKEATEDAIVSLNRMADQRLGKTLALQFDAARREVTRLKNELTTGGRTVTETSTLTTGAEAKGFATGTRFVPFTEKERQDLQTRITEAERAVNEALTRLRETAGDTIKPLLDDASRAEQAAQRLAEAWRARVMTPFAQSQAQLEEINRLFRDGRIDQETWARASQQVMAQYLKATEASRQGTLRMLEAQRAAREELAKYIEALQSRFRSAGEVARDEMAKINEAVAAGVVTEQEADRLRRKVLESFQGSAKATSTALEDVTKIWRRTVLRGVEGITRALTDGLLRQQKNFAQVLKDVLVAAIEEAIVAIVKLKLGEKILDALGLGAKSGGFDILGLAKDIGVGILTGGFSAAAVPTPSVAALSTPAPAPTLQVQVQVPAHNPNPLMMARDRQWQEAIKESLRVAESQGWRARRA